MVDTMVVQLVVQLVVMTAAVMVDWKVVVKAELLAVYLVAMMAASTVEK